MRIHDGGWHQHVGFISGITEHKTLVAGTLLVVIGFVYAHGNVRALLAKRIHDCAGFRVKTEFGAVITNALNDRSGQFVEIHDGIAANFAGENDDAGFDHGFAGNP